VEHHGRLPDWVHIQWFLAVIAATSLPMPLSDHSNFLRSVFWSKKGVCNFQNGKFWQKNHNSDYCWNFLSILKGTRNRKPEGASYVSHWSMLHNWILQLNVDGECFWKYFQKHFIIEYPSMGLHSNDENIPRYCIYV